MTWLVARHPTEAIVTAMHSIHVDLLYTTKRAKAEQLRGATELKTKFNDDDMT